MFVIFSDLVDYHGSLEGSRVHLPSVREDIFGRFGHSIFVSPQTKNIFIIGGYSKGKQRDNIFAVFDKKEISWPLFKKEIRWQAETGFEITLS